MVGRMMSSRGLHVPLSLPAEYLVGGSRGGAAGEGEGGDLGVGRPHVPGNSWRADVLAVHLELGLFDVARDHRRDAGERQEEREEDEPS